MFRITSAQPLSDFRIRLTFSTGDEGDVDLSDLAGVGVFDAWNDPAVFAAVAVTAAGALEWPGEIDLCPDSLFLRMTRASSI